MILFKKYTYLIFSGLNSSPTYQNKTKNVKIFNTKILDILNKTNILNTKVVVCRMLITVSFAC